MKCFNKTSQLSSEVQMLESRYNKLMSENANLAEEMRRKDEIFSSYAEHQAHLDERVCNLEAQQSIWQSRNYVFLGTK
jgi:predicted nuclease with TOPRIM domain